MSTTLVHDSVAESLFPKSRQAILGLLFGQADRSFYLREIVERTGLGHGHVQRELARLVKGSVIRRWKRGRHVYFQANDQCLVFRELEGLVMKTVGAAGVLRRAIESLDGAVRVAFLYGSVASGEAKEQSDVDIMVVGDVQLTDVARLVRPLEGKLGREINPTVYPEREFVAKAAARNHFISAVLNAPKIFVRGSEDDLRTLLEEPLDSPA